MKIIMTSYNLFEYIPECIISLVLKLEFIRELQFTGLSNTVVVIIIIVTFYALRFLLLLSLVDFGELLTQYVMESLLLLFISAIENFASVFGGKCHRALE